MAQRPVGGLFSLLSVPLRAVSSKTSRLRTQVQIPWQGYVTAHTSPYDLVSGIYDLVMGRYYGHYARVARIVDDLLGPLDGRRVLDLGGGTGGLASCLRARGAQTLVLDRAHGLTRRARVRAVSATTGTMLSLPYRDETVDRVIMCHVLHHLAGPAGTVRALREAYRVLRPTGLLLVIELEPPVALLDRLHLRLEQFFFGSIHCWSQQALLDTLARQGFGARIPAGARGNIVLAAKRSAGLGTAPAPAVWPGCVAA